MKHPNQVLLDETQIKSLAGVAKILCWSQSGIQNRHMNTQISQSMQVVQKSPIASSAFSAKTDFSEAIDE